MAAAVMPTLPMPTSLGTREVVDLSAPTFNLQRLEQPNICLHNCGTRYGPALVRAIFEKLEVRDLKSGFQEINLTDNKIGDEGAKYIAEGLNGNAAIKKLYLARCDIDKQGFKDIGTLLGSLPNLEEILLSGNPVDEEALDGPFCDGLTKNKSLKSLYLGVLRLGNNGIKELCAGPLKSTPKLEHLSLTYNRINVDGVTHLNAALAANKSLRYLDLSGNALGPDGAKALVAGLKANKGRLQKLSLAQNVIKFEGTKALCEFFNSADGKNMEFLDLRHNSTTYLGYVALRKMLGREGETEFGAWLLMFGKRQLYISGH